MDSRRTACIVLLLFLNSGLRFCEEYVERQTEYGKIRGFVKEVLTGKFVEMFLGVPYASPPVSELRFEYTQRHEPWKDILNTTELPPACPQHMGSMDYLNIHYPGFNSTSEDCLYLNIYVPKIKSQEENLPTMLWIHGGSNEVGMGAMLTGEVLAAYGNIIVINFNYRLGNLGFLHLDSSILPGNLGLIDQVEAIKWVHRNIKYFNGDPNTVTLAGHSAGAADVGIHLLNPNTEGLYHQAIIMSGSPLSYWAIMTEFVKPEYRRHVADYLKLVGCTGEDVAVVKRCLKSKSEKDIMGTYLKATAKRMLTHPMPVDNVTLFDYPINLISEGRFPTIPVLMGFTTDEGAMITEANPSYDWETYGLKTLKKTLRTYKMVKKFSPRFEEIVTHEYLNYSTLNINERCVQAYIQIESDTSIKVPTLYFAKWMEKYSKTQTISSNLFLYSFEFINNYAFPSVFFKTFGNSVVPHGRDIFYVFGIPLIGHTEYSYGQADIKLSKHMMKMWANFVRSGNPSDNPSETEGGDNSYQLYTMKSRNYIKISNDDKAGYSIKPARPLNIRSYDFWTKVEKLFYDWKDNCDRNNSQDHKFQPHILIGLILFCYSFRTGIQ